MLGVLTSSCHPPARAPPQPHPSTPCSPIFFTHPPPPYHSHHSHHVHHSHHASTSAVCCPPSPPHHTPPRETSGKRRFDRLYFVRRHCPSVAVGWEAHLLHRCPRRPRLRPCAAVVPGLHRGRRWTGQAVGPCDRAVHSHTRAAPRECVVRFFTPTPDPRNPHTSSPNTPRQQSRAPPHYTLNALVACSL